MRADPRAIPPPPPSQMKCPGNEVEIEADDTRAADDDIQISSDQIRSSAVSLNCIQLTVTILHYLETPMQQSTTFRFTTFSSFKTQLL